MRRPWSVAGPALALVVAVSLAPVCAEEVDSGVIRLGSRPAETGDPVAGSEESGSPPSVEGRRGFDYEAFDARLENLWFQRKAFLTDGREVEAARQADLIHAFCVEEGVRRLDGLAGALIAEANRFLEEGSYERALSSLDLAERFDPERPEVHFARAAVLRRSGSGLATAGGEWVRGLRELASSVRRDMVLVNHFAIVGVVALLGAVALFALLMLLRYQVPVRHEVEEWLQRRGLEHIAPAGGWGLLLLPLIVWVAAGWAVFFWIAVTFRFMRRGEKTAACVLLLAAAAAFPAYRVGVALYGLSADPLVKTTLAAVSGAYDPDRIVRLRQVVDTHPEDPTFRFLLAGLYKNGRYFEDAYQEYKQVLALAPGSYQAHINIGNIFFLTGQYGESVAQYRKALDLRPDSVLAYYNMYLAQSEAFRFKEAEESLGRGQSIDSEAMARLLAREGREGGRSRVVDAGIGVGSIWQATLEGRRLKDWLRSGDSSSPPWRLLPRQFLNPLSLASLATLVLCPMLLLFFHVQPPARRCIRCGRPFCRFCKSGREAREYCSQCVHLFVLGDGLAPETKTRKLYEVERYDRRNRRVGRLASLFLPGAGHLLRGSAARGVVLIILWVAALVALHPSGLIPVERILGADLGLELLRSGPVPDLYRVDPSGLIALVLAVAVWLAGNSGRWRPSEG